MAIAFPFRAIQTDLFGKVYRPVAKVMVWSKPYQWIPVNMMVDTGADYTILPIWLTKKIGVNITQDCIKTSTEGVGGKATIFLLGGGLKVKLDKFEQRVPVGFIDSAKIPPLLGRLKFLERMKVTFHRRITYFDSV